MPAWLPINTRGECVGDRLSMHCSQGADGYWRLKCLANYVLIVMGISQPVFKSTPDLQRSVPRGSWLAPCVAKVPANSREHRCRLVFHRAIFIFMGTSAIFASQANMVLGKLSHVVPVNWLAETRWAELIKVLDSLLVDLQLSSC